jgi:hypothetical protein
MRDRKPHPLTRTGNNGHTIFQSLHAILHSSNNGQRMPPGNIIKPLPRRNRALPQRRRLR